MRLDLSKWGKSQSSPSSSIPQKIKDFHQKNHALSVFMDSAGFLCILCVFVESNPPNRTNTAFFPPHFPVFVVFQKRFLYILFFTYRLSGDQCPPEIPQRLGSPSGGAGAQRLRGACRGRCRAQLFATKERYRCGLPLAGTHRPFPAAADSLPCVKGGVGEADGGIVGRECPPLRI